MSTGKKMPKNKKLGHLNQEAINYEKQRQERIDMNNQKLTALGLPTIGSSRKRKSNNTKQAKNMTPYNEVDDDYQPPEGVDKLSSSSEDEEELIPSQGRGKRLKTTAPPRSAHRNKIVPPVESTMAPLPAQDSLFALASSNSISAMATGGPSSTIGGGEGGDEIPAVAALEELPQLPDRVDYYTSGGRRRYIDIPIPEQVEYALPPSVQHVSREYMEECFRCAAGLTVVIRQQMTQRKRRASPLAPTGVRASATGRGAHVSCARASRAPLRAPAPSTYLPVVEESTFVAGRGTTAPSGGGSGNNGVDEEKSESASIEALPLGPLA